MCLNESYAVWLSPSQLLFVVFRTHHFATLDQLTIAYPRAPGKSSSVLFVRQRFILLFHSCPNACSQTRANGPSRVPIGSFLAEDATDQKRSLSHFQAAPIRGECQKASLPQSHDVPLNRLGPRFARKLSRWIVPPADTWRIQPLGIFQIDNGFSSMHISKQIRFIIGLFSL